MVWAGLRTPAMQTIATQQAITFLAKKTGTEINIGKVRYRFNRNILLKDIIIFDQHADTLLYINKISADIDELDINSKYIQLSNIKINNLETNIIQFDDSTFNFDFFIDSLKRDKPKDFNWNIDCSDLSLHSSSLNILQKNGQAITIKKLGWLINRIEIKPNEIAFDLDQLGFIANNDLHVKKINFSFFKQDNLLSIRGLNVLTEHSHINANKTKILINNDDKGPKIQFSTNLHSSRLMLAELSPFYKPLRNSKQHITLTGLLKGDANDIAGSNVHFAIDNRTSFNVDFILNNLLNPEFLKYNVTAHEIFTSKKHIDEFIHLVNDSIILPKEVDLLGDIFYTGMLKGSRKELSSRGSFSSDIGLIETNLKVSKVNNRVYLDGAIHTNPIYLDKFFKDSTIGSANISLFAKGYFEENNQSKLELNGHITDLNYNDCEIDSLGLKASINESIYQARISSFDPDLRFDCNADIHMDSLISYDLALNLYTANLTAFGLNNSEKPCDLSLNMNAELKGKSISKADGEIKISDIFYFHDSTYFATDTVKIVSTHIDSIMDYQLSSEFIDANLWGTIQWKSLFSETNQLINSYLPAISDTTNLSTSLNNFSFLVDFNYPHPITELISPDVRISPGTKLEGKFDSKNKNYDLNISSDRISHKDQALIGFSLIGHNRSDFLNFDIKSEELKYNKNNSLKNFNINAEINNDSIISQVKWNNWLNKNYSGNVSSLISLNKTNNKKAPEVNINLFPSKVIMNDTLWRLNQSTIHFDSSGTIFNNFNVNSGSSTFEVNGKLSDEPEDSIEVYLENVNLVHLNTLIKGDGIVFGGSVSGTANIKDLQGEQKADIDLYLSNLTINKSHVGKTHLLSNWNVTDKRLNIQGFTTEKADTTFWFEGYISPKRKEIMCKTHFNNYDLALLEGFLKPTLINISGRGTGEVLLEGILPSPSWEGYIIADKFNLLLEPTNVRYSTYDTIFLQDHSIHFNEQRILDKNNNLAILNGSVHHNDFKDFSLDLNLASNKILALDTRYSDNPLYHGTAYGRGTVGITGPVKDLNIEITATTLSNTKFIIPLEGKSDIKDNDFISFYNPYDVINSPLTNKQEEQTIDFNKPTTNIKLNLTVTPDAEIQIIFDPQIGDMFKATGNAEITIDAKGDDFFMYGDFMIYKGDFLFTLQNVINKQLEIQQGSHVSWSGDPINADINLDAVYKVRKASVADLTLNEEDRDQKVPVNCHLLMTNKLLNPEIKFRVEVPTTTNNEAVEQINSLKEDEINKQVLSLILVNKFTPLPGLVQETSANNTGSFGATTASELLSNQLSSWFSQITTDFDVGVAYRPKNENTEQEYEFALSTTLWDDRIAVNGNFGYDGNQNTSTTTNSPYSTDLQLEIKLNKKGNIRLTGFQKVNNDYIYNDKYTYGVGVFYTEEFNDFDHLISKMFRKNAATKPKKVEFEDEILIQ